MTKPKTAKPKKSPQPVPGDDVHDLPPVNRRVKNRPRPTKRRVVHRTDDQGTEGDAARMLGCDDRELLDVPFYSQLLAGIRNGEDID